MVTSGCSDRPEGAGATGGNDGAVDGAIAFQEIFKDRYSRITIQRGEVISAPERWQTVWNDLTGQVPPPALPVVDLSRSSVILAAMGENPDACWTVEIEGVRSQGGVVHVTTTNVRSPPSCSCPPVIVQPIHVVSVDTALTSAVFDVGTATRGAPCNSFR